MKKIGIYGGSFDPIHLGHLLLAESAREELKLDRVIFVPAKRSPFKLHHSTIGDSASASHRWKMLLLAIKENPYFTVSRVELDREPPSYTILTIDYFSRVYPKAELWLILGADALIDFHHWYQYKQILKQIKIAVGARPGFKMEDNAQKFSPELNQEIKGSGACISFFSNPVFQVSSSEIRQRIKNGRSVTYLLPTKVREYIRRKRLYL